MQILITVGTVLILAGLWFGAIYWANSSKSPYESYYE
jgi:hypothetical protein